MKDPSRVRVAGPLEPYARGFCAELARQGYARSSAVEQLKLVAHLSRWMSGESLSAGELTPERVEQFVAARRAGGRRHFLSPQGLLPLRGYLVKLGVAGSAPQVAASPADMLVERYRAYLAGERGLAAGTVRYYERVARRFLSLTSSGEGLDVGGLTTGDVSRFVLDECRFRSVGSAKTVVMALRSLLGYLYVEGLTATALAGAVPAVAPWRSASLPRTLDAAGLARLLASCDRRRATGRRDFAILMLLARLGLRAGEVAALCLDDFDWRAGEMVVRGKGDRQELLPLPERRRRGGGQLPAPRSAARRVPAAVPASACAHGRAVGRRSDQRCSRRVQTGRPPGGRRPPAAALRRHRDAAPRRLPS